MQCLITQAHTLASLFKCPHGTQSTAQQHKGATTPPIAKGHPLGELHLPGKGLWVQPDGCLHSSPLHFRLCTQNIHKQSWFLQDYLKAVPSWKCYGLTPGEFSLFLLRTGSYCQVLLSVYTHIWDCPNPHTKYLVLALLNVIRSIQAHLFHGPFGWRPSLLLCQMHCCTAWCLLQT